MMLYSIKHYAFKYNITIHGFVVMPNHIHLLLHAQDQAVISKFTGKLKEYSAKQIIGWCVSNNEHALLSRFASSAVESFRGHTYQVWQQGFDNVAIIRPEDILVKLNYIHNNPLQERWNLCQSAEDYPFSSASCYLTGRESIVPVLKIE